MAAIHHATAKRALEAGVMLTEERNGDAHVIRAFWPERNYTIEGAVAKNVLDDMIAYRTIALEWPGLGARQEDGEWIVTVADDEGSEFGAERLAQALQDALDHCTDMEFDPSLPPEGTDPEDDSEEEEGKAGNVVPATYRARYREAGHPDHCGDWLATLLDGAFVDADGVFSVGAFEAFLQENAVPMDGKWADLPHSGQPGWKGRYRMNGRQVLEKWIALRGVLTLGGAPQAIPEAFLAGLREKHAKWIAKQEAAKQTKGEGEGA